MFSDEIRKTHSERHPSASRNFFFHPKTFFGPRETLFRQPKDKAPVKKANPKTAPTTSLKGLSRTLYVVQNDIWNDLPERVRTSAIKELERLFAFVGKVKGEKPLTIKVMTAKQLPEKFDFSDSIVSVIDGDPKAYVDQAFDLQKSQIRKWLEQQKVKAPAQSSQKFEAGKAETIGRGGAEKTTITDKQKVYALPVMAGAVSKNEVIDSFFINIDNLLEKQLEKLPGKGRDPKKWTAKVTSEKGTTSWNPLEMLGVAFGRAIAHEARHEYVGGGHAESGLGQDSPVILGESTSEDFTEKDQKAILKRIQDLEKKQGNAVVAPTFPQENRSKKELFPF